MVNLQTALNHLPTFFKFLYWFQELTEFQRVSWSREQHSDMLYEAGLVIAVLTGSSNMAIVLIASLAHGVKQQTFVDFLETIEAALTERHDPRVDTAAPHYEVKYSNVLRELLQ